MRLDLSFLGWLHTLACFLALTFGAMNIGQRKGTSLHRRVGHWYLWALVFLSVTSLGIYRGHRFFFPHYLAIATIVLAGFAYAFAHYRWPRRFWLKGHIVCAVLTYYLLIGGGVNEVYLRVNVLRRLSGGFPSPMISMTHFALMVLTVVLLGWFLLRYRGRRVPAPIG
jgi:uncharacterized membrane protein